MRRRHIYSPYLILASIIFLGFFLTPPHYWPLVTRGTAGSLLIDPASTPLAASGSLITVTVKVSNMDPFNAWDVMVATNQSSLTAVGLSIESNVLNDYGTVYELINCVQDGQGIPLGQPGNIGCTRDDGFGIVHSTAILTRSIPAGPLNGVLFTITYKAVTGPGSAIHIFNDVLANPNLVPHTYQDGVYGKPIPDIFLSSSPPGLNVIAGDSVNTTIRVASLGFEGSIDLAAGIKPASDASLTLRPASVKLVSGTTNTSQLTVSTKISSQVGIYFIQVNATGSSTRHETFVTLIVSPPSPVIVVTDFSLSEPSATIGDKVTVKTTISNIGTVPGPPVTLLITWEGSVVTSHTTTLSPKSSEAYVDIWDTTGYPVANSTLKAEVQGWSLRTLNFNLTALVDNDFAISAENSVTVSGGSMGTSRISIAFSHFTGTVSFRISAPPGIECVTPSSITLPASPSTVSLECVPSGSHSYNVTVTAVSGALSHTAFVVFTSTPRIVVTSLSISTTSTIVGLPVIVTVGIRYYADFDSTVTVQVKWGGTVVVSRQVSEYAGQQPENLSIVWNTLRSSAGTGKVSVEVSPLQGQTSVADTSRTGPSVTLSLEQTSLLNRVTPYAWVGGLVAAVATIGAVILLRARRRG